MTIGKAGYLTSFKLSGTSTTLTSEAMSTFSTVARTYRVTNSAKRIFDRTQAFTFKKGATTITPVSVNYLFGTLVLSTANSATTGSVKATGKYLPVTDVAGANSYTLSQTRELLDNTDFSSTGWKFKTPGLLDVSITVSRFDNIDLTFLNLIQSATPALVEINPGGGTVAARAWVLVETDNRSGDVTSLEKGEVTLQIDGYPGDNKTFAWGTI